MIKLLDDFCARHALPAPEPDEQGHYQLGFDNIEVSLFEDLGKLYLRAKVALLPDKIEERKQLINKSCAYLLPYLYADECVLNLYDNEPDQDLILVSVMAESDGPDAFESRLAALVNRTEDMIAQLEESARTRVENRFAVFRP